MTGSSSRDEFGARAPGLVDQAVVALTSRMPSNWLGLRLAILLRRISTMRLEYPAGALDVVRWGMRLRLHPRDNGCEKNLLFTPQMYEPVELANLAGEITEARRLGRDFVFVDIGANVGLFSFFVAAMGGPHARIIAVEPDPVNFARLMFNIRSNPGVPIRARGIALSDQLGELAIETPGQDRGGTRTRKLTGSHAAYPRVEACTLQSLIQQEAVSAIDAIKIDVEGAEVLILLPFFQTAPESLWPRLLLVEDAHDTWGTDLFSFLAGRGYEITARSKLNAILRRNRRGEASAEPWPAKTAGSSR